MATAGGVAMGDVEHLNATFSGSERPRKPVQPLIESRAEHRGKTVTKYGVIGELVSQRARRRPSLSCRFRPDFLRIAASRNAIRHCLQPPVGACSVANLFLSP